MILHPYPVGAYKHSCSSKHQAHDRFACLMIAVDQRVCHNILRCDSGMCALLGYCPLESQLHASCAPNENVRDLPGYGWVPCAAAGGWFGVEEPGVRLTSETEGGW